MEDLPPAAPAETKPAKPRRRTRLEVVTNQYRKELGLTGAGAARKRLKAAVNPLRDLQDRMVPGENGEPTGVTIPVQELSRQEYDTNSIRQARQSGIRRYLEGLNIEELKNALMRDDSEKALNFLCALMDPDNRHLDPAAIAMRQKIPLFDIMAIWRNDRLAMTLGHLYDGAPIAAQAAVEAARNRDVCCPRCDGSGEITIERKSAKGNFRQMCMNCQGKGVVLKMGDHKARQMVLQATGIIKGSTGTQITINAGASAVESVIDELDRNLPGTIDVGKR